MKTFFIVIGCLVIIISNSGIAREENLLLLYSFEEGSGTTVKDLSGNGNNGTLQGDATWTKDGKIGGGVSLDGDGDFVDCGANEELQLLETDFTLVAWVYPVAILQQSFGGGIGGTIFQTVQKPRDSEGFALGIRDTGLLWWWNTHIMKGAAIDAKVNFAATTWGAIKCPDVFVSQTDK